MSLCTVVGEKHLPSKVLIDDPLSDVAEVKLSRYRSAIELLISDDHVILVQDDIISDNKRRQY